MTTTPYDRQDEEAMHSDQGTALLPLFVWHGMDVYPVFGAEGEDEGDDDASGAGEDDEDVDTGESGDKSGSDKVDKAEYDKLMERMKAADRKASELEKRQKALDDKDKSELDKATAELTELKKDAEKRTAELAKMRLDNAFLSADTGITWHDPGDALALAERKGYLEGVVGEDGKVDTKKLGDKLKQMAKASPHLVKQGDGKANSSGDAGNGSGPTGQKVGSKGSGKQGKEGGPDLSRYSRILNR